jgi:hypothetical protein
VSHRFYGLIFRVIHHRLLVAAALQEYKLILECYPPASKSTEPYLFCDYLGTPGLSSEVAAESSAYAASAGRLGKLVCLYSRFRPVKPEVEERIYRLHPAGGVPGHPNSNVYLNRQVSSGEFPGGLVHHTVNLDSEELFSQFCVATNLVKLGPKRGVFNNIVGISDGVVRIWRSWLAERFKGESVARNSLNISIQEVIEEDDAASSKEARTLWVDDKKNIGLRVRIKQNEWQRREIPILVHRDEDPAVSYAMEYEGAYSQPVRPPTPVLYTPHTRQNS